ncbi:myosin-IIIb-like [Gigantopelta aegis]|uniref:myosin-IIIb-like n=1 Tax=Gigantopelta aegis TaxID=1735272 RepID=UPI001B889172|nr:myosin-IIIb-like [Gigantopelta aegis]
MRTANDVDDLSRLSLLDEVVILNHLRERFQKGKYYTFIGDVLIALNPNKPLKIYTDEYHQQFSKSDADGGKQPHIFWIAQQAYHNFRANEQAQCVLVSGESGSGKTESTKLIIKHISYMCPSAESSLHEQIVRINPLLEALGNAVTPMNDNSSRFGKLVELFFTNDGHMSGGRIHDYMLEKSRVVCQGPGERNFHLFYYMFAGLSREKLLYYYLEEAHTYKILMNSDRDGKSPWQPEDVAVYKTKFKELMEIIRLIGFTDEDVAAIFTLLSSILHVTNIVFHDDIDTDGVYVVDEFPLRIASNLLRVDVQEFTEALISNTVFVRGERVQSLKKRHQAEDGRDSLAKAIYSRLFGWIVGQINVHLQPTLDRCSSATISILDMSGFECLRKNSFEQLCINTANERLHQFFNSQIFSLERADYEEENVPLDLVEFKDNHTLIDLFFQKPLGLFSIIDEESMFPRATDNSLVQKLNNVCASNQSYVPSRGNVTSFTISHYAGDVTYDARGMLEKNRDCLSMNLSECMSRSSSDMVALFFTCSPPHTGSFSKKFGSKRIRPHLHGPTSALDSGDSSLSRATAERLRRQR